MTTSQGNGYGTQSIQNHDNYNVCFLLSLQGDSGGPLVCMKNGAYTLVGVVSFGAQCGKYSRITPNAFASTQHFRSWISNTIAANK